MVQAVASTSLHPLPPSCFDAGCFGLRVVYVACTSTRFISIYPAAIHDRHFALSNQEYAILQVTAFAVDADVGLSGFMMYVAGRLCGLRRYEEPRRQGGLEERKRTPRRLRASSGGALSEQVLSTVPIQLLKCVLGADDDGSSQTRERRVHCEIHVSFAVYLECQALSVRESEEVFNEIAQACNDGLYPSCPSASLTMLGRRSVLLFPQTPFNLHLVFPPLLPVTAFAVETNNPSFAKLRWR